MPMPWLTEMKKCCVILMSPSPVNTYTDDAGEAVYIAYMYRALVNLSITLQQ